MNRLQRLISFGTLIQSLLPSISKEYQDSLKVQTTFQNPTKDIKLKQNLKKNQGHSTKAIHHHNDF
jgi:hypothetical protein